MRTIRFGLLVAAPLAFAAFPAVAAAPQISSEDRSFVHDAAQGGLAEIADAQVAQQSAQSDSAKKLASMIIADHQTANDALKAIADKKEIPLPTEPSLMQKGANAKLKATPAGMFDQTYAADEISDHESTIRLFKKEAAQGSDPDLKAFAQKTIPTLESHLKGAQALKTSTSSGHKS